MNVLQGLYIVIYHLSPILLSTYIFIYPSISFHIYIVPEIVSCIVALLLDDGDGAGNLAPVTLHTHT